MFYALAIPVASLSVSLPSSVYVCVCVCVCVCVAFHLFPKIDNERTNLITGQYKSQSNSMVARTCSFLLSAGLGRAGGLVTS